MAATRIKTQPGAKPFARARLDADELNARAKQGAQEFELRLRADRRKKHQGEERWAAIRQLLAGILEEICGDGNPGGLADIIQSGPWEVDEIAAYYGAGALKDFILAVKKCFHGPDELYTVDTLDRFNRLDDAADFLWDHRRRHVLGV